MEFAIREGLMSLKKIAVFDMDNTILEKSFIQTAAETFGFKEELVNIITNNSNPFLCTKLIARLLKGKNIKGPNSAGTARYRIWSLNSPTNSPKKC